MKMSYVLKWDCFCLDMTRGGIMIWEKVSFFLIMCYVNDISVHEDLCENLKI